MLAEERGTPARPLRTNFRIPEIGDCALILLFCPTCQIGIVVDRGAVSVTY